MAYKNDKGEKQYTLKEKIAYHNKCANTGKKDGKELTFSERVGHMQASKRCRAKLSRFMNSVAAVNKANSNNASKKKQ